MDLRVAHGARLILGGLVVIRPYRPARSSVHVWCMATEAKEVDVVDLKQTRVGGTVRRVARQTTFVGLHWSVFEDEGSHGVGVALGAHRELTGRGTHLVAEFSSVRVMAVTALYESHIDAVTVRSGELGLLCRMASKAQLRLRFRQHEIDISGTVRAVAGGATEAVRQMSRIGEVLCFQAGLMASAADLRGFSRTQGFEADDLGDVATAIHVGLPRTVATLASMLVAFQQRVMRSARKVFLPDFLVTGFADVRFGVLAAGRAGQCCGCLGSRTAGALLGRSRKIQAHGQKEGGHKVRNRSATSESHPHP